MSNHPIKIDLDVNGNFVYIPALQPADQGDTVNWFSNVGPFTVSFPEGSPFEKVDFSSEPGDNSGAWEASTRPIPKNTPHRVYHYRVALVREEKVRNRKIPRVLVDSGCPGVKV